MILWRVQCAEKLKAGLADGVITLYSRIKWIAAVSLKVVVVSFIIN